MDWFEMELDEKRSSADRGILVHDDRTDYLGGIIYGGQWGWMTNRYAKDAILVICTLSEGNPIMGHVFWREDEENGGKRCSIRCVEELFPGQSDGMTLLAVCLETWSDKESQPENCDKAQTQIAILSTQYSQVLRYIDLDGLYCSTLTFLDTRIRQRTRLQNFDGCLAVGTVSGAVLLCDIKRSALITGRSQNIRLPRSEIDCGQVIRRHSSECSMDQINTWLQECPNDGHLAVELSEDVAKGEVRCLICVNSITGIAAGLKDGRIVIYDLESFDITRVIRPPGDLACSVERLCDVVPPDDPKPCLFIFGVYSGASNTTALLHCIHYRHSYADAQSNELYFKNFKSSETCARLMLDDGHISVLGCTTASTFSFSGDNGTLLVIIGWYSHQTKTNKLVLFDMNQWYKDEMPNCLHLLDEKPYFVVGYTLTGKDPGLGFHLNARSIKHFISLQRYDEHFYPNSLTFDLFLLTARRHQYHVHVGSQHSFLRKLQGQNATIFLYADDTHADIVRLRLMPQFGELNPDATFSKRAIYEEILSVALEHGCMGLLKNCAKGWIDGSYMFNLCIPTELTLLTFTAWIVKRAAQTKTRCSELCESIFDYGGYPLDERERKELKALNGQLGNLDNLQAFILNLGRRRLAPAIISEIEDNAQRIRTFYTYQRVLLFFIEWGLLPEGQQEHQPSALAQLQSIYVNRHTSVDDLPYINGLLRRIGQETGSGAAVALIYPPRTLHFLLHLMLAFNTDLDNKHEVILYLLYDLDVVQPAGVKLSDRFEASFGLKTQLVTRVKSLWHLEHHNRDECMKVLSSSLCPDSPYQSWHVELLVKELLAKGAISDAMSVVYRPPGPLASLTRLKVLMASKNIPEAFEYARRNDDDETGRPLLEYFFRQSIEMRQFKALAQLCMRDAEEELALHLLRECRTPVTDSVQLILLLQKCKYIEAVSFMDEVAAEREIADESSRAIIYAYRSTMNPVSQTLAGDYFRIRENLDVAPAENVHPVPFSCQLARDYASGLRGGVFQSSALGARWATVNSTDSAPKAKGPMPCHQVPFLRSSLYGLSQLPHRRRTVRPVPHQAVEKRVREQEESELTVGTATQSTILQPSKRRRLLNEQLVEGVCDFVGDKLNPKTDQDRNDAEQQQQLANELLQLPSYLRLKRTPQQPKTPPVTILKRRTALEAVEGTPPMATSTSMGEAKRLRFMPPKPLPGHGSNEAMQVDSLLNRQQADEVDLDEDEEEEEEETDEIIVEIESASDFQRPNSNSNQSEEEEEEEDEFVSPLTSPHVSLVSPRLKVAPEPTHETIVQPMAPPAGPQPRSSLIQAGRSESSSGFGSFASILTAETASHEFVPTVCSSKMGAQSTFSIGAATASATASTTATASTSVKISERTTICGEMDETEPESATTDWYSSPSVRLEEHEPEQEHQELQMLDTTLGMSTYDVTAPEQREEAHLLTKDEDDDREMQVQVVEVTDEEEEEEIQLEEIDDEDEEVEQEQEEEEEEEEEEKDPELMEEYLQETQDDDAQLAARPSSLNRTYMGSSDDPPQERSSSPSLSLSSMSCMSSAHFMPEMMQSGDAMYSIVIESTASVTTSRSVTHTHTPTSFLPSDTNVSQNSSPRATRGTGGDGSPSALYRANSLETVDDLDTTKGSLEEEEEEEEDDCVIALDGTRVGGYVARPTPQSAPSSSAELFAFKDDTQKERASVDGPSLSVGATATSPSIVILDSSEDEADQEDEIMLEVQAEMNAESEAEAEAEAETEAEAKAETETEAVTYLDSDSGSDSVSDTGSGRLLSMSPSSTASGSSSTSKSSTIGAAAAAKKLPLAPLPEIAEDMELELEMEVPADHEEESESKAEQKEEQQAEKEPETVAHDDDSKQSLTLAFSDDEEERAPTGATASAAAAPVATRALRPRAKSMNSPVPPTPPKATLRVRLRSDDCPPSGSAGSLDRAVSTPPVSTPKRRHAALRKYSLEVIDEQKSLGSGGPSNVRTRARTQLSMEREPEPEPETDTQAKSTRSKRAHSTAPQSTTTTKTERRQSRGASEPPVKSTSKKRTRKRSTAEEKLPEAAELASVPPVRRTSRRLSSGLSDHQPSPSTTPIPETSGRELRPRRIRTDSDSVSSPATRTATPTPKQVNSEANVPLKKRGRPKIMDDGDGKSKK